MENPEYLIGGVVGLVSVLSIFVFLPWIILNFISKMRSNKGLSEGDERMLEDLWRSARTMERRIETLERLIEPEQSSMRGRAADRERGEIN
ncbi:envelope stress response membrane protein PspB [bacterium]|nr:envelope stress response membrane protein PspB [bacterium]